MRLLDRRFKYVPSTSTDVSKTFRKFGFRPTTDAEREARQSRAEAPRATVTPIKRKAK